MRQLETGMVGGRSSNHSGHSVHLPSGLPVGLPVSNLGRTVMLGEAMTLEGAVRRCLEENIEQLLNLETEIPSPYARMLSESRKKEVRLASHLIELPNEAWEQLSYVLHQDMIYSRAQEGKFDIPDFNHLTASFIATYVLAREAGYNHRQCVDLATGGFVHDIKKLPQISHKPDTLTPEERELDKLHPAEGYELLVDSGERRLEVLDPTRLHQKWKSINPGSRRDSYPEDAPDPTDFALLVAVAEVADVMSRGRNYRKNPEARKGSVLYAISELERESEETQDGLHFEKRFVDLYVPILRRAS